MQPYIGLSYGRCVNSLALAHLMKQTNDLNGEFSSADNILDLDGTRELLERNNLLPGMDNPNMSGEMIV